MKQSMWEEEDWEEGDSLYQEYDELMNLLREAFLQKIRSDLFNKISRGPGGQTQWKFIMGIKTRYPDGRRIILSERNRVLLEQCVDYMNTEEGLEELRQLGIEPPEHPDGLIGLIQSAKKDREMKAECFRLFLKYQGQILEYLTRRLCS